MQHDAIAVIDFGGQYAHLIATKVRRLGVLAEIRQPDDPIEAFAPYLGIIISGSPSFTSSEDDSDYTRAIYDLEVPIAGFCFGHQEIAQHYGGKVVHGGREWGKAQLHLTGSSPILQGLGPFEQVWMSHYDSVTEVGADFVELAYSQSGDGAPGHRFAAIASESLKRYGFQFHPEVDDTVNGDRLIDNFVKVICGCKPTWTMQRYFEQQAEELEAVIGNQAVFLLASGGVDSTVTAVLLGRTLGVERLHLLHIDNGLMRKDESQQVVEMFEELGFGDQLHFVDASNVFLDALGGVVEPERKRRIIGDTFIHVFETEAKRLGIEDHLLGQGTIYPDTIETGATRRSDTIKTHHNRVPIVEQMIADGRVVEPLAELYKVEVRELGEKLGIPHAMIWRHPFPGPGLGVRLLCNDGALDRAGLGEIEPALRACATRFGLEAMALPIRSVGVKADLRAYEHPVLLSGDSDFATLVEAMSTITAEIPGLNRCIWNLGILSDDGAISRDPPATAQPLAATVTPERLDTLREADHLVMAGLRRHGVYDDVWQCPTVLVPLDLAAGGGELVVVRPIRSQRAMTARPIGLPARLLDELRCNILGLPGVSSLALDLTTKPPGTIEWE